MHHVQWLGGLCLGHVCLSFIEELSLSGVLIIACRILAWFFL